MVNPPTAIEHCVDKYDILAILEDVGVPVPRTLATESVNEALKAFSQLRRGTWWLNQFLVPEDKAQHA